MKLAIAAAFLNQTVHNAGVQILWDVQEQGGELKRGLLASYSPASTKF